MLHFCNKVSGGTTNENNHPIECFSAFSPSSTVKVICIIIMQRKQGPSSCPNSTVFSPIQPWLHVMQLEPLLDPAALWYSRELPVIWAELLLAYTHVNRNGTTDDIFTFFFFFFNWLCNRARNRDSFCCREILDFSRLLTQFYPASPNFCSVPRSLV